ncbi:MAG TPA: ABC transporter permease [Puia sp.]
MLFHHLQNAWRAIRHKKLYTLINIFGLSVGLCACMMIFLVARYDLGFDRFHPDADRIYRIVGDVRFKNGFTPFLNSPFPQVSGIEHAIPGFEKQVGFHTFGRIVTIPAEKDKPARDFSSTQDIPGAWATSVILTGPSFFDIFPHQWLVGNPAVLNTPGKVVLSESAARKYFGPEAPDRYIGKTVIYEDSVLVTVAGIVRDWDGLTDLGYTSFISISTAPNSWAKNQFPTADWSSLQPHRSQAFVKLAKGVRPEQVNAALADFIRRNNPQIVPGSSNLHLYLQPLSGIHYTPYFHLTDTGDDFRQAYLPLLYALMGVAGFILLLAIINFINLSTAQSLQRMKEVGIRKVMGSSRKGLVLQFVLETFLLTTLAVIIAGLVVQPAMSLFSGYLPAGVRFTFTGGTVLFLLSIVLFTTLAAGLYPALLLSSYLPVLSLKGAVDKQGTGGAGLRKTLIVFQFTISVFFIIGSLVIGKQVRFMHNADKGFDSDAILTVNAWRAKPEKMQLLAQGVNSIAGVKQVLLQSNAPMGWAHSGATLVYRGSRSQPISVDVMMEYTGPDFIPFYGMRILAGRNILPGDSTREMVINETYSGTLGFQKPADAVGKLLYRDSIAYAVVGVVADFHQNSFHETIKPMAIWHLPQGEQSLGIKLATFHKTGGDAKRIIAEIERVWKSVFPKAPFNVGFLNESITQLYQQESNTAFLVEAATLITVCISCLGLFGLALFNVRRRGKEIGIRKVLGATVRNISVLLSRDFLRLVLLALVIASPIAWYFANAWLSDFAYRINMNAWILLEAGAAAIAVALLTVGFLALRAAREDPATILKRE